MTEVYLKFNQQTERYDCYNSLTDEFEQTLTCGNPFMLIAEDEDLEIPGRIEYHSTDGYYWICRGKLVLEKIKRADLSLVFFLFLIEESIMKKC